jgi:hypothetical protein
VRENGRARKEADVAERYAEDYRRRHTIEIRGMLNDAIEHVREDVGKIEDPRGQALFETTTEVLGGLVRAYEDYETRSEEA